VSIVYVPVGNITTKIKQGVINHCMKDVLNAVMQCRICMSKQKITKETEQQNQLVLYVVSNVR